jgi:hypothetical protein
MKLSVLIPVHNKARTVAAIVQRVLALPLEQEIVLLVVLIFRAFYGTLVSDLADQTIE